MNWNQLTSGMNKEDRQMLAEALARQYVASVGGNLAPSVAVNKDALKEDKTYYPATSVATATKKGSVGKQGRKFMSWESKGFKTGWRFVDIKTGAIFSLTDEKATGAAWQFEEWATHDYGVNVNYKCILSNDIKNKVKSITSPSSFAKLISGNPKMALDPYRWFVINTGKRMIDHMRMAGIKR